MIPWRVAASAGDITPLVLVMLSSSAAFNTLGSLVPWLRTHDRRLNRLSVMIAAALGVATLLGNLASAAAAARVSAPILAVLLRSQVIWVAALAWLTLRERITWGVAVGAALAIVGLAVLNRGAAPVQVTMQGTLFGVAAALCFSSMTIVFRRYRHRIAPLPVNALRLWFSVLFWFALHGVPNLQGFTPRVCGLGALAALFGPTVARGLSIYSLRHVPASLAALIALMVPVLTLGLSWLILDDIPAATELVGAAIMLCGVALPVIPLLRSNRRRAEAVVP